MSQQLAAFVTPITEPLSEIQGHFTQLSNSLQTMNVQLQRQVDLLTGNTGDSAFQGLGATVFNLTIEYYLNTAGKHSFMLEQAATLTQTCGIQLFNAVNPPNANNLNSTLVNYVLSRVTLDEIVQQGSTPVETVLQEIHNTVKDMETSMNHYGKDTSNSATSFGQAWVDLAHLNFGAAGHDFQQSGSDFVQSLGDLGQFGLDNLKLIWESMFELTAAALIQAAEDIWQAINTLGQSLASLIATVVNDIKEFPAAIWEFVKDAATFDKDMARGDYTDALLALIAEDVNPILIMEGLQPLSQGQIQEMLPPGFWQWFKSLPWWAKILAIGVVAAVVAAAILISFGARGGGSRTPKPYAPPEGKLMDPQEAASTTADAAYNHAEQALQGKSKKEKDQSNYGGGFLEVLGKPSKNDQALTGKPLLQNASPFYVAAEGSDHVEQQVVTWAIGELESAALPPIGENSVYMVRLMIYTYKRPCTICASNLKGVWQKQIWEAAGGPIALAVGKTILVIFTVFSSNAGSGTYGKPPKSQSPYPTPTYP